jgi:16S rRNA (uracil1498-N3)-methyltransferase
MPRFYCPLPLATGPVLDLPAGAARHVQVLRCSRARHHLFNGEVAASSPPPSERMGRSDVQVQSGAPPVEREARAPCTWRSACPPTSAWTGWWKKPPSLGVASIQPLMTERSVLRSVGRARRQKSGPLAQRGGRRLRAVWAQPGACVHRGRRFGRAGWPAWQQRARWHPSCCPARRSLPCSQVQSRWRSPPHRPVTLLSGPEGGLSAAEEASRACCGFAPVSPGPARAARRNRSGAGRPYTG